jgi:hypothetical protein
LRSSSEEEQASLTFRHRKKYDCNLLWIEREHCRCRTVSWIRFYGTYKLHKLPNEKDSKVSLGSARFTRRN